MRSDGHKMCKQSIDNFEIDTLDVRREHCALGLLEKKIQNPKLSHWFQKNETNENTRGTCQTMKSLPKKANPMYSRAKTIANKRASPC